MNENSMLTPFHPPQVRDLAWVIGSPPLMDERTYGMLFPNDTWYTHAYQEALPWLQTLASDPAPLLAFLAQTALPTQADYFQALSRFWFENHKEIEVLVCRQSFCRNAETIDSLDVLCQDRASGKVYHWERILGLFLARRSRAHWRNWLAPTEDKNLEDALSGAIHKQSQLGQAKALANIGGSPKFPEMIPRILCKGYFFYPWAEYQGASLVSPLQAAQTHLSGWWLPQCEVRLLFENKALRWYSPAPASGLAPWWQESEEGLWDALTTAAQVTQHFQCADSPLRLCCLGKTPDLGWCEVSRGVVMPDGWGVACR